MAFAHLGWLVDREPLSPQQAAAGAVIVLGVVLTGVFGPSCNETDLDVVWSNFTSVGCIVFLAVSVAGVLPRVSPVALSLVVMLRAPRRG